MSVRNRRGATLPLTILVIALLGVSVAITYARLSSERRTTGDGQAQLEAFAVAQSGLNSYMAGRNSKPAAHQDTTFTDLPGGTALVSLQMLRESTTTLLAGGVRHHLERHGHWRQALRYEVAPGPAHGGDVCPLDPGGPRPERGDYLPRRHGQGRWVRRDERGRRLRCHAGHPGSGSARNGHDYTGATSPIDGNPDNTPVLLGTAGRCRHRKG